MEIIDLLTTCPSSELPPSVRELLRIGLEPQAIVRLCRVFGGRNVFIPKTVSDASVLVRTIGPEAAAKLAQSAAGEVLSPPKLNSLKRKSRNARIRQARAAGASHAALSLRFGLTLRAIRYILNSPRGDHENQTSKDRA